MIPKIGIQLQLNQPDGSPFPYVITKLEGENVTIDANHPLAGKDLTFNIEIVEIAWQFLVRCCECCCTG
jgi:FKBP-type peptidyl-prolyl cis-trans isomerase 2